MVAIHNDVTEITDTRQRLARQALYDALTGIPNRYLFIDRLQEAIAAAQRTGERLAVIYIDIDNLKHVNDSLGHVQGDRLLKEVATRISACTLEHSSLARLGGDEFALFCTGYRDQAELERLMSRIVQRVAQPMELDGKEWIVTGSAGYALFPEHGTNADDLLRMADLAMYSAKRETKNSWHAYHPGLDHGRNRHLDIASGLRRAVAEDEFFLLYQPRIDSRTGKLKCMEALIRWNHPDMGVLLPAQFILTAEETGMIREIGLWVIQEAIRQNQQWRREGRAAVPISVNVSPVQFRSPHFAASVMQLLRDAGLPPSLLELEVTESLLMDESISGEPLKHLRQSGVRISIDDFGTGYSGLGYLTRFSVDTLKVDRSFTQNICNLPGAAAICESILQLARKLNLTTVAEGVEQDAQANLLRNWGCSELQGYYFGRPMPATQIEGMLQSA